MKKPLRNILNEGKFENFVRRNKGKILGTTFGVTAGAAAGGPLGAAIGGTMGAVVGDVPDRIQQTIDKYREEKKKKLNK